MTARISMTVGPREVASRVSGSSRMYLWMPKSFRKRAHPRRRPRSPTPSQTSPNFDVPYLGQFHRLFPAVFTKALGTPSPTRPRAQLTPAKTRRHRRAQTVPTLAPFPPPRISLMLNTLLPVTRPTPTGDAARHRQASRASRGLPPRRVSDLSMAGKGVCGG